MKLVRIGDYVLNLDHVVEIVHTSDGYVICWGQSSQESIRTLSKEDAETLWAYVVANSDDAQTGKAPKDAAWMIPHLRAELQIARSERAEQLNRLKADLAAVHADRYALRNVLRPFVKYAVGGSPTQDEIVTLVKYAADLWENER